MAQAVVDTDHLPRLQGTVHILYSKWYPDYVNTMLRRCRTVLEGCGLQVVTHRLPGTLELGFAADQVTREPPRPDALVCLGVVLRGETLHFDMIVDEVARALGEVARKSGVRVINEVLPVNSLSEAAARCGDDDRNKGIEAAVAAVEMIQWKRTFPRT
ncbi:MAG: 6,7-dimethyl-8-ribityllumazine synthase [Pseudomonadales bacterium]|nr:6,7-dimethyl-8-ribityllumazine synthase [Pseudomonadales bacterium]